LPDADINQAAAYGTGVDSACMITGNIHYLPELLDRVQVFRDRTQAGSVLAGMLDDWRGSAALVLGIPAGGLPVAAEIATHLGLTLDVLPVSKILLPWTTESGFGAIACDGTEWINEETVRHYRLDKNTIRAATSEAKNKVERRFRNYYETRPFPRLEDRTVILVDDGIAAGSTVRVGIPSQGWLMPSTVQTCAVA
jgi:putative phosphoribosyl transferase